MKMRLVSKLFVSETNSLVKGEVFLSVPKMSLSMVDGQNTFQWTKNS